MSNLPNVVFQRESCGSELQFFSFHVRSRSTVSKLYHSVQPVVCGEICEVSIVNW